MKKIIKKDFEDFLSRQEHARKKILGYIDQKNMFGMAIYFMAYLDNEFVQRVSNDLTNKK